MSTPAPSFIGLPTRMRLDTEQWRAMAWQLICDLRVACPGIIQSFNSAKQTVTVKLAIRENIIQNLVPTPTEIDTLVDVPIFMPRAGGFSLTLPVQAGDECLVVFADNCIDAWWQSGGVQNQVDRRRHDLSDGFAIVGVWNQTRVITGSTPTPSPSGGYSTSAAQLRSDDGQTVVEVADGVITLHAETLNLVATDKVNISAPNGVIVDGSEQTSIDGKVFLQHKHTGVQTGGGVSGPVQP